jgi:hypothetical protein
MRCVEFKNTTGLTLEGGPVTVLEGSSYVGEAMLETLKPDEERLVAYAVELGVFVLDNVDSHNEHVCRVVIQKGQLSAYYQRVQQTTYTFRNKSPHPHVVYLDHVMQGGEWRLVEPAKAHEVTENYWRFRFALSPSATEKFVVRQQQTLGHYFALRDTGDEQLTLWIEQKYLDPKSADVLRRVVALRRQAADLSQRFERLEAERNSIHAEQKRIRENLQSLGDRSAEKELRDRLVRTLNGQEDRLEQIEAESRQVIADRDRCLEEVQRVVDELEFERSL